MEIGKSIAQFRKKQNLTQAELADRLNVSYQAISQWEREETYPDISILPDLAAAFDITMDELFGIIPKGAQIVPNIPDDETLRAVLMLGNKIVRHDELYETHGTKIQLVYNGDVKNIESKFSVQCGDVSGSVEAGTFIICGNVGSYADAGAHVMCGNVGSYVDAGTYVSCNDIGGYVDAEENVTCDCVAGDVKSANGHVKCGKVEGNVSAEVILQY